jgi:processive 1,2-diacylglycerol beta-glucosyltransferase
MDPFIADRIFAYFYKDFYLMLANGTTFLGGAGGLFINFFFDKANVVEKGTLTGGGFLNNRRLCMSMTLHFLHFLCEFEPDVIVHTHFLSAEIIAGLRRHNGYTVPQMTVVTDMDVHAWWYQQPCEKYFVPRDLCRHQLELYGVPPEDIEVSGIPILPSFKEASERSSQLSSEQKRFNFKTSMDCDVDLWQSADDQRPIVMLMSGGPSVFSTYRSLLNLKTPCIIVVVCGREANVKKQLEEIAVPPHITVSILGFTKTLHELMVVADVIVTKPGGLITSEALACGLMVVVMDPYAGQEERNAAMLLEEGAGIQVHHHEVLPFRLNPILADPKRLDQYKSCSARLGRPDAAQLIVKSIVGECLNGMAGQADEESASCQSPARKLTATSTRNRSLDGKPSEGQQRLRSDSTFSYSPLNWFQTEDRDDGVAPLYQLRAPINEDCV